MHTHTQPPSPPSTRARAHTRAHTGVFGATYGSLLWNLVSRSENIQNVTCSACSVVDDAIAIRFNQTKSDQDGTKHTDNKHCYANPGNPSECFNTEHGSPDVS